MTRPTAPVLFGRRMKALVALYPTWELECGPVAFRLRHFDDRKAYRALLLTSGGHYYESRDCRTQKQALRALEQMRARIVKALGGKL